MLCALVASVPDHGTKQEENPSTHHEGMREDGQTDGPVPVFYDSTIAQQGIIITIP